MSFDVTGADGAVLLSLPSEPLAGVGGLALPAASAWPDQSRDTHAPRVLLVGVFDFGSTDAHKLLALRRLGCEVVPHPYRSVPVREVFPSPSPFDVVLVSKGVPLDEGDIEHLGTLARACHLWWPDPAENWAAPLDSVLSDERWTVSATSSVVLSSVAPNIGERGWRELEGCDFEPGATVSNVEPVRALLHFGHVSPRRRSIIEALRVDGVPVHALAWPKFGPALQRVVQSYFAVLGINTSPDLYSNRVQTVLAMGGTMLQEDAPGLREDFGRSRALLVWRDERQLRDMELASLGFPRGAYRDVETARWIASEYSWESVMGRTLDRVMARLSNRAESA